mgnify:CR=1 FL=1
MRQMTSTCESYKSLGQMEAHVTSDLDPAYALFRDQTRFWIQRVAVPLLMVIGLFGNLITVIIMTRRRMRSTTNMYLAALAVVDMLYLVLTFLLGLSHYPNMAGLKYYAYWRVRPFLMMLTDACSNTSVWLTVTFTIERYIAVKYPMKGKVWCTEARAKMLIIFVFIFGILFAAPVPFEWKVIERRVPVIAEQSLTSLSDASGDIPPGTDGNESVNLSSAPSGEKLAHHDERTKVTDSYILMLDYSDFGRNETYKTIYYWSTAVIFYFIPLFSLMLFNGFLIKSVHHSKRERTKMTRASTIERSPKRSPRSKEFPLHQSDSRSKALNGKNDQLTGEQNSTVKVPRGHRWKFKPSTTMEHKRERASPPRNSSIMQESCHGCPMIRLSKSVHMREDLFESNFVQGLALAPNDLASNLKLGPNKLTKEFDAQNDCDIESTADRENESTSRDYATKSTEISIQELSQEPVVGCNTDLTPVRKLPAAETSSRSSQLASSYTNFQHPIQPSSSQERRITIMLIAVVILFLVCQIPSAAMLLYTSVREMVPNTNEHALVLAFGNIFNFLMAVNAAGNFILYSFLSKKYRRTFVILFCSCFGQRQLNSRASRILGTRCDSSNQTQKNMSIYQNNKSSVKLEGDTLV